MGKDNEYDRRLYDNILYWYKSADAKAQVVLALDGAFIAFLTSSIFTKPEDLSDIISLFTPVTWALLGLMIIALLGSIMASIYCIWSRIYSKADATDYINDAVKSSKSELQEKNMYPPSVMWFFQFVRHLDVDKFIATLKQIDDAFECEALAHEALILSTNVKNKHLAVNIGFALAVLTLVLFAGATATYMFEVFVGKGAGSGC